MTSGTSQEEKRETEAQLPSDLPPSGRAAGDAPSTLAETQGAMLKDLVTAQLTALEAFERLIASTGPASEDLMNQFSREFMLGMFKLYPVGQEMSRHSLNAMTELAREFSAVLRSALGGIDGEGARGSEARKRAAGKVNPATG
jgi:hypothetical protein